ncbi:Farnesyl diphosphate synthase [Limihaloglobus sulfuriphilus]|uniref:Farnesyl diphosphate synthase n=1 Tax=Limihaloglobus sulfuriphilus TaxID=1851148 RepID=A0A1Q2MC14_9BACT|nr:farnesyl diphosphate synthase [Limihaloglobus sulfuriphilus]AQQ70221.1 Farnesyl diphosphate synthase [Limihaloglobus sulfuriphilus]
MTETITKKDFTAALEEKIQLVNSGLTRIMDEQSEIEPTLREAMRYTLLSGGKRIRAALVMWICEILRGEVTPDSLAAACAIEMVHTYSLVHDDLPAMDNDDLRRGRPTVHVKYDVPTAILTGDALLTLAFEVLVDKCGDPQLAVKLVGILAGAAGPAGMIAGQMADILGEKKEPTLDMLEYIHYNKTAMMFFAATTMGALTGKASPAIRSQFAQYGVKLGLCFQIADDILDITSNPATLGKTTGKDASAGKLTYPAIKGLTESKQIAENLTQEAENILDEIPGDIKILKYLTRSLLNRTK